MNTLAKLIVLLVINITFSEAQNQSAFDKGMTKAFELMQNNKLEEAENLFERIANADSESWLPHYYVAFINSMKSWDIKDEATLKVHLDKAQVHLDQAFTLSENNPELYVMQPYVHTNWVAFDGMKYGMKLSPKITELYQKAYAIDSNNPRVVFGKAEWDMGSARFFGKDITPYCDAVDRSLELFTNFKPESEFHPSWGKERAEEILADCN